MIYSGVYIRATESILVKVNTLMQYLIIRIVTPELLKVRASKGQTMQCPLSCYRRTIIYKVTRLLYW